MRLIEDVGFAVPANYQQIDLDSVDLLTHTFTPVQVRKTPRPGFVWQVNQIGASGLIINVSDNSGGPVPPADLSASLLIYLNGYLIITLPLAQSSSLGTIWQGTADLGSPLTIGDRDQLTVSATAAFPAPLAGTPSQTRWLFDPENGNLVFFGSLAEGNFK